MPSLSFDDLFAYRFQLLDNTNDESIIISRLKILLISDGMSMDDIDNYLFLFYITIEHPITIEEINNIHLNYIFINNINILNNNNININEDPIIEEDDDSIIEEDNINNYNDDPIIEEEEDDYFPPVPEDMLYSNTIFNQLLLTNTILSLVDTLTITNTNNNIMEDVVVTTNIDELQTIVVKDKIEEKCTICLQDIIENAEVYDITCKHLFHKQCLAQYLDKYNHICPLCRCDIGTSKANIN